MINIMIVEDEAPIQRSIKSAVEASGGNFKVIATAYNAQEALDLLQNEKPDIIISDIRMPVMDGIALTEIVRATNPQIEMILLSGYEEFDYARKAMTLGVRHYLLKPVSRTQIKELLDAVCFEMLGKRRELYAQYAASLVYGKLLSVIPFQQQELYESHIFFLCCAGPFPTFSFEDDIPGKVYWEQNDLQPILRETMRGNGDFAVINGKTVSERIVILSFFQNRQTGSEEEWLAAITARLGTQLHVSVVSSGYYSNLEDTASISQTARSMLYKHILFGAPVRLFIKDAQPPVFEVESDPSMERKLAAALERENINLFKAEIQLLLAKWKQRPLRQNILERKLQRILTLLSQHTGKAAYYTGEMLEIDVNQMVLQSKDYQAIFNYTCTIIDFLSFYNKNDKGERENDKLAEKIEQFLLEHYTEQINHQTLSERFGLVPSYLSKVFIKYKGLSPAKYIVRLRIETAKKLLVEHPGWLAKDIAELVGYPDPNYFSRIFKRETGMYPSQYREQKGEIMV
ncbi:response regulator [Paenibacillus sp. sptzw28]|uniref:response regulator n=1 Tax=Paenibacillus sp. sptzw28 TaxID=715179 RepID=UPI001C6E0736|nr:response regulator [Paenibacillus sp. sptzw28]QYR21494.1 response regulator [Paenibacillus sp. sptzw28]